MSALKLTSHPRLYLGLEHLRQLRERTDDPALRAAEVRVSAHAERLLADATIPIDTTKHNWHLIRARRMQQNAFALLVEFKRTGKKAYREAITACLKEMARWDCWSWIAMRAGDLRPEGIFDLSYGENATTLAVLFDLLHDELDDSEKELIQQLAQRWVFKAYLAHTGGEKKAWFYDRKDSNWNTVCNGGAGMLALALYEKCPEAERVLELADRGVAYYFEALQADGAWPEGIGYWNYGMRYGYMYLLSHERATGQKHRLLERPATQATLVFPLLFSPNGVPCSFGDVNEFSPLPFHLAAAERYGRWDIVSELLRRAPSKEQHWSDDSELLLLHPRSRMQTVAASAWKTSALMDGIEWGYAADRMPNPSLYISVRGGTTKVPHAHLDLLSFFCMVGDELLIDNVGVSEYHDSTFGPRRFEIYEFVASSKNSIFINGAGVALDSTVAIAPVSGKGFAGFRIDATEAMGKTSGGPAAKFCGRMILLVDGFGVLVADRIETAFPALAESRLHTFSNVEFEKDRATIRGKRNTLHAAFAATLPSLLKPGQGLPTAPADKPDTMLRHFASEKITAVTLAAYLSPERGNIQVVEQSGETTMTLSGPVGAISIVLKAGLNV